MILILAHLDDLSAVRLHCALRAQVAPHDVRIVSVEELALAPYWTHALGSREVRTSIRLADGTTIGSDDLELVVQRLRTVPVPHFAGAKDTDRAYAATELHALLLSWLASLPCPVVNTPDACSFGGRERGPIEWAVLAARAGLPTRALRVATSARRLGHAAGWLAVPLRRGPIVELEPATNVRRRILVAGERVIGDLDGDTARACARLARDAGCRLLEVELDHAACGWRFGGARAMADISDARTAVAVAEALLADTRHATACA